MGSRHGSQNNPRRPDTRRSCENGKNACFDPGRKGRSGILITHRFKGVENVEKALLLMKDKPEISLNLSLPSNYSQRSWCFRVSLCNFFFCGQLLAVVYGLRGAKNGREYFCNGIQEYKKHKSHNPERRQIKRRKRASTKSLRTLHQKSPAQQRKKDHCKGIEPPSSGKVTRNNGQRCPDRPAACTIKSGKGSQWAGRHPDQRLPADINISKQ